MSENGGNVKDLYTYYAVLNRLSRVFIIPRDENIVEVTKF
jgi:hypothetical protein